MSWELISSIMIITSPADYLAAMALPKGLSCISPTADLFLLQESLNWNSMADSSRGTEREDGGGALER